MTPTIKPKGGNNIDPSRTTKDKNEILFELFLLHLLTFKTPIYL